MNKVVALSLVSVFLLSILVGYLPVLTTQAQTATPQTYVVPVKPPFIFAIVITNVHWDNSTFLYFLNDTLNNTQITITLKNAQTGQVVYSFTGNLNYTYAVNNGGYANILYSPAAQAVIIPIALNYSTKYTLSLSQIITAVQGAITGITVVNTTYPYVYNVTGQMVKPDQNVIFTNALGITYFNKQAIVTQSFYTNASNPNSKITINGNQYTVWDLLQYQYQADLASGNLEVQVYVPSISVPTTTGATVQSTPASATLFAPISIVNIYNPALNNKPMGWGRSLINITIYNPIEGQTNAYTFQLNFTGPGLIKVDFLPFAMIYSTDQLALQKPTIGMYSFTGPETMGSLPLNYTIVVLTLSQTVNIIPGYKQVKPTAYPEPTSEIRTTGVYMFGITLTTYKTTQNNQPMVVNQVGNIVLNIGNNQQVVVPVYGIYYNSSLMNITLSNLCWYTGQDTNIQVTANGVVQYTQKVASTSVTIPVSQSFTLQPIPVTTQLSVTAYEEIPASVFTSTSAPNQYSGYLFTTPYGPNGITGTVAISGYDYVYKNSTANMFMADVYINAIGQYVFKHVNLSTTGVTAQLQNVHTILLPGSTSYVGAILTPAYPYLNGTAYTSVLFEVEGWGGYTNVGQAQATSYAVQNASLYIYFGTAGFTLNYGFEIQTQNNQNVIVQHNVQINGITTPLPGYVIEWSKGQLLNSQANAPYFLYSYTLNTTHTSGYSNISPSTIQFSVSVSPTQFYQALVNLGLWTNSTIVYVKGYAVGPGVETYNYGYFYAVIIPPSIKVSNVTPSSFVCGNAVNVQFYSPDDMLTPGYASGYTYYQGVQNQIPWINGLVSGLQFGSLVGNNHDSISVVNINGYFLGTTVVNVTGPTVNPNSQIVQQLAAQLLAANPNLTPQQATQEAAMMVAEEYLLGNISGLVDSYFGLSNYTEQSGVNGGLTVSASMPNGLPVNWTYPPTGGQIGVVYAGQVNGNWQAYEYFLDLLPTTTPGTTVGTGIYNVTVYVRYQLDYANGVNTEQISPGIYYGPANTIIVVLPPSQFVGSKVTLTFTAGDYAVHYFFPNSYSLSTTITVPNATLALKAPKVVPLYMTGVPVQLIEPYYAMPTPAQLQIGTSQVTVLAPSYNLLGVRPATDMVGVGNFTSITIKFANGTTEKIYLTGSNITNLFQSGIMNENGSCTGAYNATISIQGLMKILHLTSVSQLNGSCLTITYYDNITHETATAKICFGGVSVVSPITITPAYIFYILTAKYINATFGYPVTLAQSVAVEPFVSLNDTFLAKAQAGVVANLNVINVTIIDHYGNKYVIYYNSTNSSTNVMINGVVKYAYSGNLLPTIPETAPNTGVFNGTPITFVINMPGTIYKNGTVFNGTLAVKLGSNVATLGPATNFALPAFSFAGKLFGYNSTMYVTVEDPTTGSTLTLKTYIAAYNITPIRIAPVTIPVPMPANASIKLQYVDNQPITLTPTNQYIVIHVTSIINYTYVFYIATVVQPGKNATTTPPVLVNFQTVVPVPVIGPGIVAQVPVQFSQIGALGSGYYTITMFAVPFAGGPVISLYPAKIVFTNVYVNTTVV